MLGTWFYLLLNLLTISFPVLRSFEPRIHFVDKWKYAIASSLIVMLLFIPWDVIFTMKGIWGFNPRYLSGIYLFELPIGEWLFFLTVPFSCIFIYECVLLLLPYVPGANLTKSISIILILALISLAILNIDRSYTAITFGLTSVFLFFAQFIFKLPYLGRIYLSYLFVLLPFFAVNGLLTGSLIPEQVVWYNDSGFMGFRIGTIPFEDSIYGFLLIALNISIYLRLQGRSS